jgi:hypothetical protein
MHPVFRQVFFLQSFFVPLTVSSIYASTAYFFSSANFLSVCVCKITGDTLYTTSGEKRLYRLWMLFSGKVLLITAYNGYFIQFTFTAVLQ